jgi:hypothetical protein
VSCTTVCPQNGFTCQQGLCVADPAVFAGCSAYRQVGTACDDDTLCESLGIYAGHCEQGMCTRECDQDTDCPSGTVCGASGSERYCLPP